MTIQDAVKIIKIACTKWSFGYDQSNRCDFRDGGETDCSALVIITCERAGLLPKNNIKKGIGATYTGNMRTEFKARGWSVLSNLAESRLRPGDVLLVPHHHTAMYVGNGKIAQARIDEHGNISGGASGRLPGGRETVVQAYYNRPWKYVLRFHSAVQPHTPAPAKAKPGMLDVDGVFGDASARKLQAVLHLKQTGKIGRPTFKALQTHIGAPYKDGIADNQNSAAIAAHWPALSRKAFTVGSGVSASVKSLQARVGVKKTGELDEKTARALQKRLNTGQL